VNLLKPSLVDCSRTPTTVERPLGIVPTAARYSDSDGSGEPLESTKSTPQSAGMTVESARDTRTLSSKLPLFKISCQSVYDSLLRRCSRRPGRRGSPPRPADFPGDRSRANSRARCSRRPRSTRDDTVIRRLPRNRTAAVSRKSPAALPSLTRTRNDRSPARRRRESRQEDECP